ncbi:MAG TPA: EAL domain-containing protein [Thermoanaerobaculia bacterium]|nr:EAL domain-containing protein [Thermoanaerobaculia bacterium]
MKDLDLDARTLDRLDRWRQAHAVFLRADDSTAERALAQALGRSWSRGQVYGRTRRVWVERVASALPDLEQRLGLLAARVHVSPEDPGQTKWDAVGSLVPLPLACRQVRSLWFVDVIRSGEFFVEFQPIFDLHSGNPLGFEGLLRALSADGTRHLAAEIFPAALVLGVEKAFERASWVAVLDAARRLPESAMLFLNVNPQLLTGASGLSGLGEEAERMEFPYARLALDLVEIERVESLEGLQKALSVPHDLGVAIALDDVTSGYETLRYCSGLSPRWIKVDSEITRHIARDAQRRAILQLLSQVANDSRVALIAEGIENAEDLSVCVEQGVFAAQGYFLGRPHSEPVEASPEFRAWLAARPSEKPGAPAAPRAGNGD